MSRIITALQEEWLTLVTTTQDHVADWASHCPALTDVTTLDDVLSAIRRDPDTVLAFLIAEHQAGDHLAGRTVLHTMLPKVMTQARVGRRRGAENAMDDLVTQMWIQIDRYPLERRPRSIAANLGLDTLKYATTLWTHAERQEATDPTRLNVMLDGQTEDDDSITAREIIALAADRGLVTPRTAAILRAVYVEGLTGAETAEVFGCSTDSIRFHCSKAVRRHLAPLGRELIAA